VVFSNLEDASLLEQTIALMIAEPLDASTLARREFISSSHARSGCPPEVETRFYFCRNTVIRGPILPCFSFRSSNVPQVERLDTATGTSLTSSVRGLEELPGRVPLPLQGERKRVTDMTLCSFCRCMKTIRVIPACSKRGAAFGRSAVERATLVAFLPQHRRKPVPTVCE